MPESDKESINNKLRAIEQELLNDGYSEQELQELNGHIDEIIERGFDAYLSDVLGI